MPRSVHATFKDWSQRWRERRQLLMLSDRTLNDLGLTRADVEGACAVPFRQAVDIAELDLRRRRRRPRLGGLATH